MKKQEKYEEPRKVNEMSQLAILCLGTVSDDAAMLVMGGACGGGLMVLKPTQNVRRRAENKLCKL